jgi:hypothetical protein
MSGGINLLFGSTIMGVSAVLVATNLMMRGKCINATSHLGLRTESRNPS